MKIIIIFLILISISVPAFATTKITELTSDASPTSDDLLVTVNDPDGTPATRKVTIANTESVLESLLDLQDQQGAVTDAQVPNDITVTLAATATALAANGANCSAGEYPLGVNASGASESCTAQDDVPEAGDYTNLTAGTGLTAPSTGTLNFDGQVVGSGHATNQTASFSCSITGICGTSTTMQALQKWPMTGTFSHLYAVVSTAPGAGKSWTITVYVNNSSTSLTCQITDANTSCSDTSNSASITAAQSVDVRWTAAGSPSGTVAVFFTSKFVPS